MEEKTQTKYHTIKDLKNGKYEINITIPADIFEKSYQTLLEKNAKDAKVPGFRNGKVPKNVVEEQLQDQVLIETFERIAPTFSYVAIGTEKLEPMAPVKYTKVPEKLTKGQEVNYTIEIVTMPKFTVCDTKKIKVEKPSQEVTTKELDDTMAEMFKNQANGEKEMSDKWATDVAGKYGLKGVKDLAKLKEEVKTLLASQKKQIVEGEFQKSIMREAVKLSKIEVPDEAVEYEAHEREHSFMHQLEDQKIPLDEYLKAYSVTQEQLHEAWHADARQALEEHAFLNEFAKAREIKIVEEEFIKFMQAVKGNREDVVEDKAWVESLRSLFLKNKGFEKLLAEVKENLGIADAKPKNDIQFAS